MDELPPPPGISEEDWHATPPAVQSLLVLLMQRVQALEARLNQTSRNSSKPPSSDPPSAPPRPLKVARGRKAGGQPGHSGTTREPPPPEQIHETIHVYPTCCPACATALSSSLPDTLPIVTTYVWEIPVVVPLVTAYIHHTVDCPTCQQPIWTQQRPAGAPPGAFGPRVTALTALLHGRYRLSDRETADYLATVWHLPISLGSVVAAHERVSAALAPIDQAILTEVQQQERGNADETSWRESGHRCWLWTLTTDKATSYRLLPSRGRASLEVLLGSAWRGVLGCDRWSAYRAQPDERRQLCWAHLTRTLRALAEAPALDGLWGAQALLQVETLWQLWVQVRSGWLDRVQLQVALRPIQEALYHLLLSGTTHTWTRVAGFSRDVLRQWEALWTFVRVEEVEPTNNAAEQALRPAVLWRKGCFGTRSPEGSRFVERMLSVVMTCRQQQRNVFAFLTAALQAEWAGLPAPDIFQPA